MYIDATRRDAAEPRRKTTEHARVISSRRACLAGDGAWILTFCFSLQETLFPYVRQNLKEYIETKWEDEEFKRDYEKLKEQVNILIKRASKYIGF